MGRELPKGVRVVGTNRIQVEYTFNGERRRDRLPWRNTARNLRKAAEFKAELDECVTPLQLFSVYQQYYPESKYHRGSRIDELLTDYLERNRDRLAPGTYRDFYNNVQNFLIPELGHIHIQHLRWKDVREFLDERRHLSRKRLHNLLTPLRLVCARAVEDEEIAVSPFQGHKIDGKTSQHEPDPFDLAEIEAIARKAEANFANMIRFACFTGLRTGELIGLEWQDVDFDSGYIRIQRNVTGGKVKLPKTEAGVRDVCLLKPARDALTAQRSHTFLAGGRVFHDPLTHESWKNDTAIRKRWMPLMKKTGVRYRRPYSTRDTFASLMLTAGEDPMWVAKQMGHRDWGVIRRTYAKWIDTERRGGARAEALLAPSGKRITDGHHVPMAE